MRRTRRTTIVAALVAAMSMIMANLAFADLKTDTDLSTNDQTKTIDVGQTLTGGETYNATTGLYYTSNSVTSLTFAVNAKPSYVSNVTGDTINGSGRENAKSSTITVVAPCTLGDFGSLATASAASGSSVTYQVTAFTRSSGIGAPGTADAWLNIGGEVTSLGPNCPSSDTTAPSIASFSINDGAAWTNTTAVSVDINASDNVGLAGYTLSNSAISGTSPAVTTFGGTDIPHTLGAGDGTKTVYVRVFDAAGNYADSSDTIGLDTVKPTITGNTGTYVQGQWTNESVVVGFSCTDNVGGSGIGTDTVAGTMLTGSGADQQITNTGVCIDNAGNSADAATVNNIDIDKVLPVNTVTGPTNGTTYTLGSTIPTAGCETNDALSGTASTATVSTVDNATIGSKTVTCSGGTDNAGNTALDASVTYYVQAVSTAFAAPVDRAPTVNKTKTGRNVPLKWRLTDAIGMGYSGLTIAETQVRLDGDSSCSTLTATDEMEVYSSTTSGLQNLGDGYYQIDWKTPSTTGCRKVTVTIPGGGGPSAVFQFTK